MAGDAGDGRPRRGAAVGGSRGAVRGPRAGAPAREGAVPRLGGAVAGAARADHGDRGDRQVAARLGVLQVPRRPRGGASSGTAAAVSPTGRASPTGRWRRWCGRGRRSSRARTTESAREKLAGLPGRARAGSRRSGRGSGPRLANLLGLEERADTDRQDLFAAWRLFFERLADAGPVVLVFEDLQWADQALAGVRRVPARVVGLAAPLRARALSARAGRAAARLRPWRPQLDQPGARAALGPGDDAAARRLRAGPAGAS